MKAITFNIELLQPLLVTQLGGGDENSAVSLDYIPGSVLRNALAARYIASKQLGDAAADPDCRALFFDDRVCVLNALPTDRQGQRSLPTPLSWYADKDHLAEWNKERKAGSLSFYDAAIDPESLRTMDDAKLLGKNPDNFCYQKQNDVEFVKVEKRVSVHISREHKRQLATKADSQVFSYQSLAEGQTFCGAILSADETLLGQMAELLRQSPEFNIGGSRSAGYGLVRVKDIGLQPTWQEYLPDEDADEEVTVITLLSDVVARNEHGQFCDDIGALLGIPQKPERCFRRIKTVGGFNRKWGLPLPQAQAIEAGSVFVYPAGALDKARGQQAIAEGIGERRQDGFGRIAVNWQTEAKLTAQQIPRDKTHSVAYPLEPAAQRVAQRIVDYRLRQQLEQALQKAISKLVISGNSSNTVLSRLRLAARQAVAHQNLQPIRDFLRSIEGKQAEKSLRAVHLKEESLFVWVKRYVDTPNIEGLLQWNLKDTLSFNDTQVELTEALQHEYTARLIEGVTRRKVKQNKEEKEAQA